MNPIIRRVLGESVEPLPVIQAVREATYMQCPHCRQEIYEKHTFCENGIDHHSDCGKPIKFPPPDPSTIPDWLKPYMPK